MLTEYNYWLWESVLSNEWCDKAIEYIKQQQLEIGTTGGDRVVPNEKIRKSFVHFTNEKFFVSVARDFIMSANKHAKWNFDINAFEDIQLSKYGESHHYSWHRDNFLIPDENTEGSYNLYRKVRKLSFVANLSEENSYEGGDFLFDYRDGEVDNNCSHIIDMKNFKKRGSVIVFPSYLFHTVKPVTKGIRYSMVNWARGWPWK